MKRRLLSILLAAAMLLSMLTIGAGADWYTTTYGTCYKDDSPNSEIYLVTDQPYSDYVYYGAKYEPYGGVYYGRICEGGETSTGDWGVVNGSQCVDESAVSFYTCVDDPYSMEYWSYLYGPVLEDGEHVLLLNLNFNNEADDCYTVLEGKYDEKLITDFQYLSTLDVPVFLRIAGEVNVWENMPWDQTYVKAYRHVAALARQYCPNAALIFSPNSSSSYEIDMDCYYPGDDVVDWIGASLYYNRYANNNDESGDAFYGVNAYADPVLKLQQIIHLSDLHSKPVMITEGGSAYSQNGRDVSAFAAERIRRACSMLTMVYPQVKCVIYSDSNFGLTDASYSLYNNAQLEAVYDAAVAANPTLLHNYSDSAYFYTKLSAYTGAWEGNMHFAAYTWSSEHLTAHWYLDGQWKDCTSEYPYNFTLNADSLSEGDHTLEVRFSNGECRKYFFVIGTGSPFADARDPADYYYDAVLWAANAGIVYGTSDTTFSPDAACTRCQFVTFLWRAAGEPEPETTRCTFRDVDSSAYYYKAMLWAVGAGIVYGTSDTTFSPDAPCTRAQAVSFLYRAAGSPSVYGVYNPFRDVAWDAYYYAAVCWAVKNGITSGVSDTSFAPDSCCTRCQTVTFLYRDRAGQ